MSDEGDGRERQRVLDVLWGTPESQRSGLVYRVADLERDMKVVLAHAAAQHAIALPPETAAELERHLSDDRQHREGRRRAFDAIGVRVIGLVFGVAQSLLLLYIASRLPQ